MCKLVKHFYSAGVMTFTPHNIGPIDRVRAGTIVPQAIVENRNGSIFDVHMIYLQESSGV